MVAHECILDLRPITKATGVAAVPLALHGMLATVINALAMQDALEKLGVSFSASTVKGVGGPFPAKKADLFLGNAGTAMREATEVMMKTHAKQRKQSMILLIVTGALMLITACVFMGVSVTLFSRLKTVDAMLLAVGKRVTELNTTMETVASVNEALQNLAGQQEQAHKQQQQLEAKLDEVLKSTQGMPAAAAKQLEDKSQAIVKQVQSMDARMQSQAASLQRLSQQVKGLEGQIADSGQKIRSEVENMSRQQRERQLQAEQAAAKAAAQKPKEREPLLQYPRLPIPGASAPATVRP